MEYAALPVLESEDWAEMLVSNIYLSIYISIYIYIYI